MFSFPHSSYPHIYMYTPVLESHTPQGATPPGRLVSLCDTPTMLPPQEMVPYNPEPFTGTGYRVQSTLCWFSRFCKGGTGVR